MIVETVLHRRIKKSTMHQVKGSIVLKRLFFGMLLMVMGYSAVVSANVAPTVSITAPLNDVVMTPAPADHAHGKRR